MSNEPMKIPVNYAEAAETLKKVLDLKGSPVAFKLAPPKEEIPAGMEELDKTIRYCSMVNLAGTRGKYSMLAPRNTNVTAAPGHWAFGR